jgi:superfamily II RNA helicase
MVKGAAYHHGGMLPILKDMVQILYEDGAVSIVFATQNFAWQTSCKASTVVMSFIRNFDGESCTGITSQSFDMMSRCSMNQVIHLTSMYNSAKSSSDNPSEDIKDELVRLIRRKDATKPKPLKLTPTKLLKIIRSSYNGEIPLNTLKHLALNMTSMSYYRSHIDWTVCSEDANSELTTIQTTIDNTVDYIVNNMYVLIDSTHDNIVRITRKGHAVASIDETCNGEIMVHLLEKSYDKVPMPVLASIFAMFVNCEVRKLSTSIPYAVSTEIDRFRELMNKRLNIIADFDTILDKANAANVHTDDWSINTDTMCAVRKWFESEQMTIETAAEEFNLHNGTLYKALIKFNVVMHDLRTACTCMMMPNMKKRVEDIIGMVKRKNLTVPSLFISRPIVVPSAPRKEIMRCVNDTSIVSPVCRRLLNDDDEYVVNVLNENELIMVN